MENYIFSSEIGSGFELWGDTNCLNCTYPGESHTIHCNIILLQCMGLLEHFRQYLSEVLWSFSYDTDLIILNVLYTDAIIGLYSCCHQVVINASQLSREQWGLCLLYCRLVLSSTHFGKWDNLKLFDSIVTDEESSWKKLLSFPRPFCENARRNTDIFSFFQSCPAVTTKIN